jgi:uncharacterized protein (TIRG00374 family)
VAQGLNSTLSRRNGPRPLTLLGTGLVLVLGAVFVLANRSEVPRALRAIHDADPIALGGVAVLTLALFSNYGVLYAATYRAMGLALPFWVAVRLATAAYFLNLVSKSGGLGGLVVFLRDARFRGQPRGHVISAYMLAALLGHVAFGLMLAVTLVIVWVDGHITIPEMAASAAYGLYFLVYVSLIVTAARSRSTLRFLYALPTRLKRWVLKRLSHDSPDITLDHEAADELYDAVHVVLRSPRRALVPGVHALLVELIGVAMIWLVLRAFGVDGGPVVPFVAYTFSVLFASVGILPAGVGLAEVSLGAILVSFGVDGATAVVAVMSYRLFEVWLPFLAGAWLAHTIGRKQRER